MMKYSNSVCATFYGENIVKSLLNSGWNFLYIPKHPNNKYGNGKYASLYD